MIDELHKYKRKIIAYSSSLMVLGLLSIFLIIGSAEVLRGQWYVLSLIGLLLLQILIVTGISRNSIQLITSLIREESLRHNSDFLQNEEDLDKGLDEKIKEESDLSFDLSMLKDSIEGCHSWEDYGNKLLANMSKQLDIVVGILYAYSSESDTYVSKASYAYYSEEPINEFSVGEGFAGQVVKDNRAMFLTDIPEGYVKIISGLGEIEPKHLSFFPIVNNDKVLGLLEIGSFKTIRKEMEHRAKEISEFLGSIAPEL